MTAFRGEWAEERTGPCVAEPGLPPKTPKAERLRVQIAHLLEERFGRVSERLAGEIEHLELQLDEVLADIVGVDGADDAEDETVSAEVPRKTTTRRGLKSLPEGLPRRDVEHLPAEG